MGDERVSRSVIGTSISCCKGKNKNDLIEARAIFPLKSIINHLIGR